MSHDTDIENGFNIPGQICESELQQNLRLKIEAQAKRLDDLTSPDQKRARKRVLQTLGKLKKALEAAQNQIIEGNSYSNLSSSNHVQTELSRKDQKKKMKIINTEIAGFAQKKLLKLAIKKFCWAKKKGYTTDVHTYTNLLNAYVRCGDHDGSLSLWQSMISDGILPNIVTYTTLLKSYAEQGDLEGAWHLYKNDMKCANVTPNQRFINTFLRGCVRFGAVDLALKFVKDSTDILVDAENASILLDQSSYEAIVGLLNRAFRVEEAEDIYNRLILQTRKDVGSGESVDPSYSLSFCTSLSLLGVRRIVLSLYLCVAIVLIFLL